MKEGYLTSLWTAMLFFRACRRLKIESVEDRTALLREIVRRGKARYIRDVAEYTKDKKVAHVTKKGGTHASN